MDQKKICFLQYDLRGGGAERKVCTLANYFVKQECSVEIALFGRRTQAYQLEDQVKVVFINRESYEYHSWVEKAGYHFFSWAVCVLSASIKIFSKRAGEKFQKHFQKKGQYTQPIKRYIFNRPNAVFITMMAQHYIEVMSILEKDIQSHRFHIPYIVMECNNPRPGLDATARVDSLRNKYYPMATKCVMMTAGAKSYFLPEIQRKSVIIPNPTRDDLPCPYYGKRRKTIITYCRLNRQKNLPLLIVSFAAFHRLHSDYHMEIYGEGEEKDALNALIAENGIEGCAHIYPFDPQLHQKIRDCAMFVSSSDWEGFPNSVLEALALGMPVISTDCDFGPRDMITDHVNGLLTPVGDAQALTDAMLEVAENPELAEALGRNAVKVREEYAPEKIGRQWLDLIEEVKKEYM